MILSSVLRLAVPSMGRVAAAWPALLTAALGIAMVYVAGFAGSHSIHEAAHDARHSMNFPCH